jgi:hypothetical protein
MQVRELELFMGTVPLLFSDEPALPDGKQIEYWEDGRPVDYLGIWVATDDPRWTNWWLSDKGWRRTKVKINGEDV